MADSLVVDASPLIVLTRAEKIDLLSVLGTPIHVPESVRTEVQAHLDEAASIFDSLLWLHTVPDAEELPLVRSWDLGAGESAVLEWAHAHQPAQAIMDDYAARKLAAVLGVRVTGTLGIALLAKRRGVIPSARALVEDLLQAGLYLSESLIEQALQLVGE
jgi:predicted nucleic acid-binding protein